MLKRLRKEMIADNVTFIQLAKLIGKTEASIRNKVYGATKFTVDEALKINAEMFPNVGFDELFEEELE